MGKFFEFCVHRLSGLVNYKVLKFALFTGICGGIFAMCVDIDHFVCGRCVHTPLLILALCLGGYCVARIRGLPHRVVLKNKETRKG